ncbi:B3/4 domain-containing protein [Kitasatospora sp. NPDC088391]|uniref:B3/B4 domain-containing protein n=1 Tax=Kitasatospora sp. NPDC088391 TaxID=3364074 RepID=UPI00380089C2
MTALHLHPAVAAAFPAVRIAVVTARDVRGTEPWPAAADALAALESLAAGGGWQPADEHDPRIAAWHAAYRAFGSNPRRVRPSVDALGRRLAKQGALPRITPAVDCYNAVSVRHALPAGAFDLAAVDGDLVIRFADGTEEFTPLGEPDTVEHPKPGEVVYTDGSGVLTRHWNHRDTHRTRVTEHTTDLVLVLETLYPDPDQPATAAAELAALLAPHCATVTLHHLNPRHPRADL